MGRLREYEERIALLSQEIERLNATLRQRLGEIDEWKSKYSRYEITVSGNE